MMCQRPHVSTHPRIHAAAGAALGAGWQAPAHPGTRGPPRVRLCHTRGPGCIPRTHAVRTYRASAIGVPGRNGTRRLPAHGLLVRHHKACIHPPPRSTLLYSLLVLLTRRTLALHPPLDCSDCWHQDARQRPSFVDIVTRLQVRGRLHAQHNFPGVSSVQGMLLVGGCLAAPLCRGASAHVAEGCPAPEGSVNPDSSCSPRMSALVWFECAQAAFGLLALVSKPGSALRPCLQGLIGDHDPPRIDSHDSR